MKKPAPIIRRGLGDHISIPRDAEQYYSAMS